MASKRILILIGHPDPGPQRLCRALADAYENGALKAGHTVERIDLARLDVPLLRSAEAFGDGEVPAPLDHVAAALKRADHLFLVFPLWLGGAPALLKALLEQVMRPGIAFAYRERGFPEKLLAGRSARLVVTMGMPALLYALWYGAHGVKALERGILNFVGISPVRRTLIGSVGGATAAQRARWIEQMGALGQQGR